MARTIRSKTLILIWGMFSMTARRKRYCMNSAALRFISVDELETEGYGQYLILFGK
jgi:hypothetical protein